jgi:CheY-like chemotaxis protein
VLLVDDDTYIRDVVTQLLEDEGYLVFGASNGQEALSALHASLVSPCLILLDLMMPIMNGWDFREAQLADPALAAIPVVVLSADPGVATHARAIDAANFLLKPIDFDLLLELVAHHCRRSAER